MHDQAGGSRLPESEEYGGGEELQVGRVNPALYLVSKGAHRSELHEDLQNMKNTKNMHHKFSRVRSPLAGRVRSGRVGSGLGGATQPVRFGNLLGRPDPTRENENTTRSDSTREILKTS